MNTCGISMAGFWRIAQEETWEQLVGRLAGLDDPEAVELLEGDWSGAIYEAIKSTVDSLGRFVDEKHIRPVGGMEHTWDGVEPDLTNSYSDVRYYADVSYYPNLEVAGKVRLSNKLPQVVAGLLQDSGANFGVSEFMSLPVVQNKILEIFSWASEDVEIQIDDYAVEDALWNAGYIEVEATGEEVSRYDDEDSDNDDNVWGVDARLNLDIRVVEDKVSIEPAFEGDTFFVRFRIPIRVDVYKIIFPGDDDYSEFY